MNTDIRLFRGTSKKHLDSILRRGLQPRGTNPSNWEDFPSAPDRVLSDKVICNILCNQISLPYQH